MRNTVNNMDIGMADIARQLNEEYVSEGFKEFIRNAALASLMTVPTFTSLDATAADSLNDVKATQNSSSESGNVTRVKDVTNKSYNGLSRDNLKNLIATIAYNETMTDYIKNRDKNVIYAFLNLIDNRAGGKLENVAKELKRPGQFYSFNKHVPGGVIVDSGYKTWTPMNHGNNTRQARVIWNDYLDAVEQYMNGNAPDVIGNRNMLANSKIDSVKSYNSWGKNCDKKIGSQNYGYEKSHDGYRRYKTTREDLIHIVKPKENLTKIAKQYNTTVDNLVKLNNLKNSDIIKIGQKLIIKKN